MSSAIPAASAEPSAGLAERSPVPYTGFSQAELHQNTIVIHGVNGRAEYPVARVRVEIRGFSKEINAAIGGDQGVLVGTDVLADMFRDGFTIADAGGGRANRRATTFWLVAAAPTASVGARRTHDSDDIENEPSAQRRRVW